jgi:hypothetical protein
MRDATVAHSLSRVELQAYGDGDFCLTEALETDAEVMRELGGPIERARLHRVHRRRLADTCGSRSSPSRAGRRSEPSGYGTPGTAVSLCTRPDGWSSPRTKARDRERSTDTVD